MKNPLTPAGIEPAIFRFVAQRLNHCVPEDKLNQLIIFKADIPLCDRLFEQYKLS